MSFSSSSRPPTLILLPNWLGDLVMSLPALASLRERGPVHAVGARSLLELLEDSGLVDRSTAFDRRGSESGLSGLWKTAARLRETGATQIYVLAPSLRAAILAGLSGVSRRVGFAGEGRSLLLNESRPGPSRERHLVGQWLELVGGREGGLPELRPGPRARAAWASLREARGLDGRAYFAMAPGASYGPTKRWPEPNFAELARRLEARRGWTPVFVGSTDARERALCESLAGETAGVSCAGHTELPALAALLAGAELFVGNDSGPMHLAAAVGTPTVGIFGSSSPAWTAPRGRRAVAVGPHPVPCAPCFRPSCGIGIPCLTELSVDAVEAAISREEAGIVSGPKLMTGES